MTHPEWALKHKTKGTELRNIRGKYYLYRISSKWDKERKVTRKITHEMIGSITEENGLIPKGTKIIKEKRVTQLINPSNISVKESGASTYLKEISSDILMALQQHFPNMFQEIFSLAILRLLHQAPLKNMMFLYESSMLSEYFTNLDLSKNKLTSLIKDLGNNRLAIASFMKSFVQGIENIVFDTTHSISQSKKMSLNQVGYNSQGSYEPQVNLFYMFSSEQQMPVYYRIFPGNIQGITALKLTIKEAGIKDACMVGDKGFFSEHNIDMFEASKIQYILPLKRNSRFISYDKLKSRSYQDAFDGHFLYNNRPIFFYRYTFSQTEKEGTPHEKKIERKIIVFHDPRLRNEEEASYLQRVSQKTKGYTMEGFQEKQFTFGTMAMVYNLESHKGEEDDKAIETQPQKIYEKYKSRMEVETVFDMYKNLLQADKSYMQSDDAFEAWVFINHLATILYYKIFNIIKEKQKLGTISPKDLLMRLSRVSKLRIGDEWMNAEISRSSVVMFKTLNIPVT